VAHEIKNPLTPIRLGVQHLRRARAEGRAHDFDATLEETAVRRAVLRAPPLSRDGCATRRL